MLKKLLYYYYLKSDDVESFQKASSVISLFSSPIKGLLYLQWETCTLYINIYHIHGCHTVEHVLIQYIFVDVNSLMPWIYCKA